MKIEDVTDIRPGDIVTFVRDFEGHTATVTGEVWEREGYPDQLFVGPYTIRDSFGALTDSGRGIVSVDRPVTVPTGKYAVVLHPNGDVAYVRLNTDPAWPWEDDEGSTYADDRIRSILENGGTVVFKGVEG